MRVRRSLGIVTPPGLSAVRGIRFDFDVDFCGEMFDMAQGYYELETLSVMHRYLKPGGVFLDVGSNAGYFSAIALGLVGEDGVAHAFEPVPRYVDRLVALQGLNPNHELIVNAFAAGEERCTGEMILSRQNVGGNTLINGLLPKEEEAGTVPVEIRRLDEYIAEKDLRNVQLIKIDTEGYEYLVLKGLSGYFASAQSRPPVVMEITTKAYDIVGVSLSDLDASIREWGYQAYRINDFSPLNVTRPGFRCGNVLLLPQ